MTPARTGTQADHWHRKKILGYCPCFGYPDYKLKYILQSWASLYLTGSIHSSNLLTLADITETVNQSCLFTDTLSTSAALAPHAIQLKHKPFRYTVKIIGKFFHISGNFERIGCEVKKEVKFLNVRLFSYVEDGSQIWRCTQYLPFLFRCIRQLRCT